MPRKRAFDYTAIQRARLGGKTLKTVANDMGCSIATVCNAMHEIRGKQSHRGRQAIFDHERIRNLVKAQLTNQKKLKLSDIAKQVGCCYNTVRYVAKKSNLWPKAVEEVEVITVNPSILHMPPTK